jgi:polygalacturonase
MSLHSITRRESLRLGAGLGIASFIGSACSSLKLSGKRPLQIFDVLQYGAVGDGNALDTRAFQRAIDEAAAAAQSGSSAQVLVRGGRKYVVAGIVLKGNVDFHLADDAEILVSTNPLDYGVTPGAAGARGARGARGGRGGRGATNPATEPGAAPTTGPRGGRGAGGVGGGGAGGVFTASGAHGLKITGTGIINGRSPEFMDHYDEENEWWRPKPFRPRLLQISGSNGVELHGITLKQAPSWTIHLTGCQHSLIDHIIIQNQLDVPNCDGIDPDHCQDLEIRNCHVSCGDDAIVIKTTAGGSQYGPSTRIRVKDCVLETRDSGVKIGTETTQDIFDIVFERCKVIQGCRGICIQLRDAGNIYNVEFRDITFTSRYFSAPWWGRGEGISLTAFARSAQTRLGSMHDIRVRNVTGRCENSVRINGSPAAPARDILLENVSVTLDRWTKYQGGVFDNRPPENDASGAPNIEQHGNPGIHVRNAENVTVRNCNVAWGSNRPEYFTHALEAEDVSGLKLEHFRGDSAHPQRFKAIVVNGG